jgi:hypothetical protein
MIGYDLDFDVARSLYQALHKNGWIAEGLKRLGAGVLECLRQFIRRPHLANPAPAASGSRLDKDGIAQPLGVVQGGFRRLYRPAAPGCYFYIDLLG